MRSTILFIICVTICSAYTIEDIEKSDELTFEYGPNEIFQNITEKNTLLLQNMAINLNETIEENKTLEKMAEVKELFFQAQAKKMTKNKEALKKRREALTEKVEKLEETQVIIEKILDEFNESQIEDTQETQVIIEKMLDEFNDSQRIKPNYLLLFILIVLASLSMYQSCNF